MNLAVEIAGSVLGEHASNAHHSRFHTNEQRLTLAPCFTPETTETPIKAKRSEPSEFTPWAEGSFHTTGLKTRKTIIHRHPHLVLTCGDQIVWPTGTWTIMASTIDRTMS
jgi:hypothetical protein